jgi:hypothetical protein
MTQAQDTPDVVDERTSDHQEAGSAVAAIRSLRGARRSPVLVPRQLRDPASTNCS